MKFREECIAERDGLEDPEDMESGYVSVPGEEGYAGSVMRDVEVIRVSKSNVIARGRRYGRLWFLKGLREELRDSASMQRQLQKEFEVHSRLRHPSIVQAVGLENVEGLGLCIVQEWVDGVTLHQALQNEKMKPSERRRIVRELIKTVAYMHSQGVVHRDLKPSNVMIRDIGRELVLVDFGLSDTADYVEIKGPAGTPGFISPEQSESGGANPADDVYSLGVIISELTPGYSAIARRCVAPLAKRPADAGKLMKMLDRRDRRLKIFLGFVFVIAAVLLAVFAVQRIRSLESAASSSEMKVSELSAKNADNIAKLSSLKDSLTSVKGNLDSAQNKLLKMSEYENLKRSSVKEGCRLIDSSLQRYEQTLFADCETLDQLEFNERQLRVVQAIDKIIKDYCISLDITELSEEDIEVVKSTLTTYFANQCQDYQAKWMKKRNAAQKN